MLFTVGYFGYRGDEFVKKLQEKNIGLLIDVRTSPVSRQDWANGERLKKLLNSNGVAYRHYVDLGGRPTDKELFVGKNVDYDKLIASFAFNEAIGKVVNGLKTMETLGKPINIVFMCAEKEKEKCHRWLAVAKAFMGLGYEIEEIER